MRVNHDANIKKLVEKYGVKPPGGKAKHWKRIQGDQPWRPSKKQLKQGGKMRLAPAPQTWLEKHRDFLRWKKTPAFQKWRRKQFRDQGGTCYYCDVPLPGIRQNVEHVIPKISPEGTNNPKNLVLACWKCNKEKYTKILKKEVRAALEVKNAKKKGTYHKLKELYPSEDELVMRLREFC